MLSKMYPLLVFAVLASLAQLPAVYLKFRQ